MKIKKLIAIDVDGTLVDDSCRLSPLTEEYLRTLSDEGYMIVLASGRPQRSMMQYYEKLHCFGPLIACNGALVLNPSDDSFPHLEKRFPKENIADLYRKTKGLVTSFVCETTSKYFSKRLDKYLDHYFPMEGMEVVIGDLATNLDEDPFTCLLRSTHEKKEKLSALASVYPGIKWRSWHKSFYSELYLEGVNKGSALAHILDYYQIKKEDVLAFGDADNDEPMLQMAKIGYAMKDAKSSRLTSIYKVTPQNVKGNGLVYALKEELRE